MNKSLCLLMICFWAGACTEVEDEAAGVLAPVLNNEEYLSVLYTAPDEGEQQVSRGTSVEIMFNKEINVQRCIAGFSITPYVIGSFMHYGSLLTFNPDGGLADGTYVVEISKDCEDLEGRDLLILFTLTFYVGDPG